MISMDKKYRTRDGRDVRLLCVDGPELWPVIGIIDGDSHATCWTANGNLTDLGPDYHTDLIEYHEPDIRTIWVNVHDRGCGLVAVAFNSEEESREYVDSDTLVVAKSLTFEVKK